LGEARQISHTIVPEQEFIQKNQPVVSRVRVFVWFHNPGNQTVVPILSIDLKFPVKRTFFPWDDAFSGTFFYLVFVINYVSDFGDIQMD